MLASGFVLMVGNDDVGVILFYIIMCHRTLNNNYYAHMYGWRVRMRVTLPCLLKTYMDYQQH